MSNYKIIKVPFPVDKIQSMKEAYDQSKSDPGGFAVRYRMPKGMVKMINEKVGAGDDETYGMGLGKAMPMTFLLQPRQYQGVMNAKEKDKSYLLVLSAKQLKQMTGQGLFSNILINAGKEVGKAVLPALVSKASNKIRGKGGDGGEEDYQADVDEESSSEQDMEGGGNGTCEDCEVCPSCQGSGLLPLLAVKALMGKKKKKHGPPPPGFPPKNMPRPLISM